MRTYETKAEINLVFFSLLKLYEEFEKSWLFRFNLSSTGSEFKEVSRKRIQKIQEGPR